MHLLMLSVLVLAPEAEWELITHDGDVKVWRREVAGTDLLAFRGVGLVRAPIGKLVTVSMTPDRYAEWTEMLTHVVELERRGPFDLDVWEHYDQPWPVSDRDFVYRTRGTANEAERTFTIRYGSVLRRDAPEQDCCVRGEIIETYMKFTALPNGSSRVEVEVLIDPKGWLPKWLVNFVQKEWPLETLAGFRAQAARPDVEVHPDFADWHERGALAAAR